MKSKYNTRFILPFSCSDLGSEALIHDDKMILPASGTSPHFNGTENQISTFREFFSISIDLMIFFSMLMLLFLFFRLVKNTEVNINVRRIFRFFIVLMAFYGITHLADALLLLLPVNHLAGFLKAISGTISLGAAMSLGLVVPYYLKHKSKGKILQERIIELEHIKSDLEEKVSKATRALTLDKQLLKTQSNKLQLALQVGKIGVWEWDIQTNHLFWDKNMFVIFECLPKDFKHTYEDFARHVHPDDIEGVTKKVKASVSSGKPFNTEFRLLIGDRIKHLTGMARIIKDGQGKALKLIGTNQDITATKEFQERLETMNEELEINIRARTSELAEKVKELQEANDDLKSFSYSVSHDLRAPLRALSGFSDALQNEFNDKLGEKGKRWIHFIKRNTNRMDGLINDILALSRTTQQSLRKNKVNMNLLIREAYSEAKIMYPQATINFQANDLHEVHADYGLIRQLCLNIISNAIKYSSRNEVLEIKINSIQKGSRTIYSIKDNGVGFDENYKDKLFVLFQRLHSSDEFEGTGIGLTIAKKIVTKHGGDIWAESKPGEGATFYFSLPT